jgi:phosphoribosylanthranilate isomerase
VTVSAGVKIKICGVTREEDAAHAAGAGADLIGLNLWPGSKRHVALDRARALAAAARAARPGVEIVGLFVDADPDAIALSVRELSLDRVQLHGDETPAEVARHGARAIKAVALGAEADLARLETFVAPLLLIDTPSAGKGGSGVVGDWALARRARDALRARGVLVALAGGLDAGNVAAAIAAVAPDVVDVASGVESAPGVKDAAKVDAFVAAARGARRAGGRP